MQDILDAFRLALQLLLSADPGLIEIIGLSLRVSFSALLSRVREAHLGI